jgi:2',3'-cyclic-nucleotide 2'-phosphodiesterase (5'-nucleotidase family)
MPMSICKTFAAAVLCAAAAAAAPPVFANDDGASWRAFAGRDEEAFGIERIHGAGHGDRDLDWLRRHRRPFTIKIIGFNDFHGNRQSPGTFGVNTSIPAAQRPLVGGAEFVAAYVDKLKAQNPLNVVVGAGDLIGASPLVSALFFDEPSVAAMNQVGLEFNAVGNHEFDKGSAELERLQHGGCKVTNGDAPASAAAARAVDEIYERALRSALQLLIAAP